MSNAADDTAPAPSPALGRPRQRPIQYRTAEKEPAALALARRFIAAKIRNCHTLWRRNGDVPDADLDRLKRLSDDGDGVSVAGSLLGV